MVLIRPGTNTDYQCVKKKYTLCREQGLVPLCRLQSLAVAELLELQIYLLLRLLGLSVQPHPD